MEGLETTDLGGFSKRLPWATQCTSLCAKQLGGGSVESALCGLSAAGSCPALGAFFVRH